MAYHHNALHRLNTALLISELGNFSARVTLPLLVYDVTGSSVSLAASLLVTKLPTLLLGNPIGIFVRQMDAKRVMIASDGCAVCLFVGLALWHTALGLPGILSLFFCAYILIAVFDAAKAHCVAVLCPERQAMNHAVATLAEITYLTIAVGPLLGGYLIEWFDVRAALLFNCVTSGCSIVLVASLHIPVSERSRWLEALRSALRVRGRFGLSDNLTALRHCTVLAQFSILYLLRSVIYGVFNAIVPVLVLQHLRIGSAGLGLHFLFSCLGGLVGARLYKSLIKLAVPVEGPLQVRYIAAMSILEAGALALCAAADSPWGFYLAGFCFGIPMLLVETRVDFIFLHNAPPGRKSSLRAFQQFIKSLGFTIGIGLAIALAPSVTSPFVPLLMFCGLLLPLAAFAVNHWPIPHAYVTPIVHK